MTDTRTERMALAAAVAARRSFRAYLLSRRYRSGRGRPESWRFVIHALGDESMLAACDWATLRRQLDHAAPEAVAGARNVWRSYQRWRDGIDAPPFRGGRQC